MFDCFNWLLYKFKLDAALSKEESDFFTFFKANARLIRGRAVLHGSEFLEIFESNDFQKISKKIEKKGYIYVTKTGGCVYATERGQKILEVLPGTFETEDWLSQTPESLRVTIRIS